MNKALIIISASLVAACGSAATPVNVASEPVATARPASVPATDARPAKPIAPAHAPIASSDDDDRHAIAELERALLLYQAFITRAGDDPAYAEAVTRSKERIADIRDTLIFFVEGIKERGQ